MQSLFVITSIICSKSKIICIEELEQNLSPKLQYQILAKIQQLIKSNQFNQLILSSHTSVYSKSKLGLIYFLEKVKGETVINKKEEKELSKKLKEHLAEAQFVFTDKDLKEMQDYLKREHDFK
jgi:predicted ATPase